MGAYQHKKKFGQHFLHDKETALRIVHAFTDKLTTPQALEIGPGEGALTEHLLRSPGVELFISEIDPDIIPIISGKFGIDPDHLVLGDFLQLDFSKHFKKEFSIIGNFPYNISTEIVFRIISSRQHIPMMTGMFQKEVAERIAAKHGSKIYGITSVLTQAFYDVEYLFTVEAHEFTPPPKVQSAVIRMVRKPVFELEVDEAFFFRVVKMGFNQRRKTLRNALKGLILQPERIDGDILQKRAEQLSVNDFIHLTRLIKEQL